MSQSQIGSRGTASLGTVLCGAAVVLTAFGSATFAQDAAVAPSAPQAGCSTQNQVTYAPQYTAPRYRHSWCCDGPYKGFYPCNAKTPYLGGACNVYGDAPIYTAPADYGHHCAAHCP
jgi:hypothetical protein